MGIAALRGGSLQPRSSQLERGSHPSLSGVERGFLYDGNSKCSGIMLKAAVSKFASNTRGCQGLRRIILQVFVKPTAAVSTIANSARGNQDSCPTAGPDRLRIKTLRDDVLFPIPHLFSYCGNIFLAFPSHVRDATA